MAKEKHKIWQTPWGYPESLTVAAAIVAVGFMLQFTVGEFDFRLLQSPVNLFLGGVVVTAITLMTFARKSAFIRWFSGVSTAVALTATLTALGIIMGLTPQVAAPENGLISRLGFDNMTSSWAFVLIYLTTLLSLGTLIARKLIRFRWREYAFYLNHIGLWLVLFAAGLGAADMKRYVMHVREGETEWRVYSENNDVLELPIAIELNDFGMEEYPPSLAVIDRETGAVQPEANPQFFQIDPKNTQGELAGWRVRVEEYIHDAVRNSDTTYREAHMPGASPAARVSADNGGKTLDGWVCAGNISQLHMTLDLNDRHALVMTRPEPKRFVSDINVYTKGGRNAHAMLEVNNPLRIGHWMLYQYDYDKEAGRLSTYSSIELVYDPWLIPVYAGLIMLMCGSVCMLWSGNRRKEGCDDVE